MLSPANIRANVLVKLGELTGKTHALPLVLFSPTARCNSRCVSCDWWRADGAGDLSLAEIDDAGGRSRTRRHGRRRADGRRAAGAARRDGGGGSVSRARDGAAVADQRAGAGPPRRRRRCALPDRHGVAGRAHARAVPRDPRRRRAGRGGRRRAQAAGARAARRDHGAGHHPSPQLPLPARSGREVARDGAGTDLVPGGQRRCQLGGVQSPGRDCRRRRTTMGHRPGCC